MLKKGNSPLAQRARAASRILEQQVGTNDRIKVQRDDAFVPWDNIMFKVEEEPSAIEVNQRVVRKKIVARIQGTMIAFLGNRRRWGRGGNGISLNLGRGAANCG